MRDIPQFERIERATLDALREIGAATIAGALSKQAGIRNPHLVGLQPFNPGAVACGQAVTLQFMPKREDVHWGDEYAAAPSANCTAARSWLASPATSSSSMPAAA